MAEDSKSKKNLLDSLSKATEKLKNNDPSIPEFILRGRVSIPNNLLVELMASFALNTRLREMRIIGVKLNEHIVTELSKSLKTNKSLTLLELRSTQLSESGAQILLK
jgi:hypothetical protein